MLFSSWYVILFFCGSSFEKSSEVVQIQLNALQLLASFSEPEETRGGEILPYRTENDDR